MQVNISILDFVNNRFSKGYIYKFDTCNRIILAGYDDHYWKLKVNENKTRLPNQRYRKSTATIPFVNDELKARIAKIVKNSGIDCNIAYKNTKIYNLTDSQRYRKFFIDAGNIKGDVYKLT